MEDKKYWKYKQQLDLIRDDITLRRWKILSAAYKEGKRIWGFQFSIQKLSEDMELSYTTTKRCLALDRCNKRTWNLIQSKKISVFKVAMICSEKDKTYQDEIVDMVIKDKLSTPQISGLKIKGLKDINKERHRIAIQNGYSRKDSAAYNFKVWIDRGFQFMALDKNQILECKVEDIKKNLIKLNEQIKLYVDEL